MKEKKVKTNSSHRTEDGTYFPYGIFISEGKQKGPVQTVVCSISLETQGGEVKAQ